MKVELTLEQLRTILDALDYRLDSLPLYDEPERLLSWRLDRIMSARKAVKPALQECAVIEYENR